MIAHLGRHILKTSKAELLSLFFFFSVLTAVICHQEDCYYSVFGY